MAEASEFMRASDAHGHNTRMSVRFSTEIADHIYRLIGEDRGIEYRNVQDAVRDWVIDGAEAFAERLADEGLSRAVSAFSLMIQTERRLQRFKDEVDLLKVTDDLLRSGEDVDVDYLVRCLESIKNPRNAEEFRRVCQLAGKFLPYA